MLIHQSHSGGWLVTFKLFSSDTPGAGQTGLVATMVIDLFKNGVFFAAATATPVEVDATRAEGLYSLVLAVTEIDALGALDMVINASGAMEFRETHQIVPWNPNDPLMIGASVVDGTGGNTKTYAQLLRGLLAASPMAGYTNVIDTTVDPPTQTTTWYRANGGEAYQTVDELATAANGMKYWANRSCTITSLD